MSKVTAMQNHHMTPGSRPSRQEHWGDMLSRSAPVKAGTELPASFEKAVLELSEHIRGGMHLHEQMDSQRQCLRS